MIFGTINSADSTSQEIRSSFEKAEPEGVNASERGPKIATSVGVRLVGSRGMVKVSVGPIGHFDFG
jgi:hypothetical protein